MTRMRCKAFVPMYVQNHVFDASYIESRFLKETSALGSSDFCGLFTEQEWQGFEYTLDLEYYYVGSYSTIKPIPTHVPMLHAGLQFRQCMTLLLPYDLYLYD